ncbi:MAG: hypothetical protein HYU66_11645 [Armatimonadetes bacterium]|nr:hypothetical protein [Armatimonadota bacterium]
MRETRPGELYVSARVCGLIGLVIACLCFVVAGAAPTPALPVNGEGVRWAVDDTAGLAVSVGCAFAYAAAVCLGAARRPRERVRF